MPSPELHGYTIRPETRMAFIADLPSRGTMLLSMAIGGVVVALMSSSVVIAALWCTVGLGIFVLTSELDLVVVEDNAIVLMRRGLLGKPRATRLPFEEVALVERGNEYHPGRLWLRTRNGGWHDLSFVMKGRRPRFTSVMSFGRHRFRVDPKRAPVEAAAALCELLVAAGVVVQTRTPSRFERINNFRFFGDRHPWPKRFRWPF